jgi:hypothetical protein
MRTFLENGAWFVMTSFLMTGTVIVVAKAIGTPLI